MYVYVQETGEYGFTKVQPSVMPYGDKASVITSLKKQYERDKHCHTISKIWRNMVALHIWGSHATLHKYFSPMYLKLNTLHASNIDLILFRCIEYHDFKKNCICTQIKGLKKLGSLQGKNLLPLAYEWHNNIVFIIRPLCKFNRAIRDLRVTFIAYLTKVVKIWQMLLLLEEAFHNWACCTLKQVNHKLIIV